MDDARGRGGRENNINVQDCGWACLAGSIARWRCLGCLVSLQRSLRARASASAIYAWVSLRRPSFGMSAIKLSFTAPARISLCLHADHPCHWETSLGANITRHHALLLDTYRHRHVHITSTPFHPVNDTHGALSFGLQSAVVAPRHSPSAAIII